ncbi:hypothetical protein E4U58_005592 [Claviceps cyperi]|nr:hypothetical protein E4U58_005592 [Claviceps cyperi]
MAHDAQIAGAAYGAVPMDIDSGTRGLDQSRHHSLSGLGGTNVESVAPKVITARERVPKRLKADYGKIASLIPSSALEGVWPSCQSMLDAEATRVRNASAGRPTATPSPSRTWAGQSKRQSRRPFIRPPFVDGFLSQYYY